MVLFLILNIPYYRRQVFLAKRKYPIFILPVEFKIRFDHMIDEMWTVPFHIADEFRMRNFWRDWNCEMNMVFGSTDGMDKSFQVLRFGSEDCI